MAPITPITTLMKREPKRVSQMGDRDSVKTGKSRRIGRILKYGGFGVAAAVLSFSHAASEMVENQAPEAAAQLWPGNDDAWVRQSSREIAKVPELAAVFSGSTIDPSEKIEISRSAYFAKRSLLANPAQDGALRNLAFVALLRGDAKKSARITAAAYATSRRDVATQMLQARDHLVNERIAEAISSFDVALRVNSDIREQIFPLFAQAVQVNEFKSALLPYVRADNDWLPSFLLFALQNSENARIVGEIIAEAEPGQIAPMPGTNVEELAPVYLVSSGEIELARRIAMQLPEGKRPSSDGGISNGDFSASDVVAPFGWSWTDASNVQIRRPSANRDTLEVGSIVAHSGEIGRQLLTLRPGVHRIDFEGTLGGNADWTLRCTPSGRELLSLSTGSGAQFSVPASGCEGQWLRLSSRALGSLDIALREITISPVTAR